MLVMVGLLCRVCCERGSIFVLDLMNNYVKNSLVWNSANKLPVGLILLTLDISEGSPILWNLRENLLALSRGGVHHHANKSIFKQISWALANRVLNDLKK